MHAETELMAFLQVLHATDPDASTQCPDWSAHDLLAHLTAGSREMAELLESPVERPTRGFVEREEPFRRLSDAELRQAFLVEGLRLMEAIDRRSEPVLFTGARLTVDEIVTHGRSELVLHRFDLTGGDEVDRTALADPVLLAHAVGVVGRMDAGVLPPALPAGDDPAVRLLAVWAREAPAGWLTPVSQSADGPR